MILKGSQRAGGQDLAVYLMRLDENDHVLLHELRGFASDDLKGAFKEAQAISQGTKCKQYLFSLSLNPPEHERVTVASFEKAIGTIEERLGLQGQPRAIVFHEKEGRRHAHCVWSRIDAETMTARQMSFYKRKLNGLSQELYLEHGWKMPAGIANAAERNPTNFDLAEWHQAKRQGVDPRWIKQTLQDSWKGSDGRKAFAAALEERGFWLAKGDRRGLVVVDHNGEVYALARALGIKTKELRDRLGDGAELPGVEETKKIIGQKMAPAMRRHIGEARTRFQERSATLAHYKMEMRHLHRDARHKMGDRQKAEWQAETLERAARMPKGMRGLWHRITGRYQQQRLQNEAEAAATRQRFGAERQELIDKQRGERGVLQTAIKDLRQRQAKQLLELREDVGRYLRFTRGEGVANARAQGVSLGLKLER